MLLFKLLSILSIKRRRRPLHINFELALQINSFILIMLLLLLILSLLISWLTAAQYWTLGMSLQIWKLFHLALETCSSKEVCIHATRIVKVKLEFWRLSKHITLLGEWQV